jgi:hypothetical protein
VKSLSLIPVLGIITCLYLMSQLGASNWMRFALWLSVGLGIYFLYSRKASKLRTDTTASVARSAPATGRSSDKDS